MQRICALNYGDSLGGRSFFARNAHYRAVEYRVFKGLAAQNTVGNFGAEALVVHIAARQREPLRRAKLRGQEEVVHMYDLGVQPLGESRGKGGFARRSPPVKGYHGAAL